MTAPEPCACGQALHYIDAAVAAHMQRAVETFGPMVTVTTPDGTWSVPRHYIALHGLNEADLPELALEYGWAGWRSDQEA